MILTYGFLEVPDPPQSIIDAAMNVLDDVARGVKVNNFHPKPGYTEYQHREIVRPDGTRFKTAGTHRYRISDEFDDWVREYFQQDPANCGISIYDRVGPSLAPHVDTSRNYTIQYLLDLGGEDVQLIWYREKDRPVLRPDMRSNYDPSITINDYSKVEEIDRTVLPLKKWACLNAAVLHSVENVEYPRIAIQISRDELPEHLSWTYTSKIDTL